LFIAFNPATLYVMPRFEPFPALRYSTTTSTDVTALTSPPYDVFDEKERNQYAALSPHNIVRVDYPIEADGPERYSAAAATLQFGLFPKAIIHFIKMIAK